MNEAVAKAINFERQAAHITIAKLAEESGVNVRTLNRILQAQRNINVIQLKQLADVLGVYPHEIVEMAEAFARKDMEYKRRMAQMEALESEVDDIAQKLHEGASPSELGLAANYDPNKEAESETPYE